MRAPAFLADIGLLLSSGHVWDPQAEAVLVWPLIALQAGEGWRGEGTAD